MNAARDDRLRAVDAAWSAYYDSCTAIDDRWDAAKAKREEKNTSQLDRIEKLLVNVRTEEFDNWCKESDDGAEENTHEPQ